MILAALLGLFALPASIQAHPKDDDTVVICFVGHRTSHGFGKHEYMAGCRLIEHWLRQAYPDTKFEGRYAVPWPDNETEFYKDADTVVFFCSGGGGHVVNKHVPEFDKVMRTGAGLACLHYAVEVPIGPSAKGMLAWMGGYFEKNWSVNPHWIAEFKTFPTDHPAARGIKPFHADDEWYFHMRFQGGMNGVTPILSAVAPEETMKRPDGPHSGNPAVRKAVAAGKPQHVAWAYQRGENYNHGRGYGFTGLHYHWNWQDDNFRKTVLNGVAWTANLKIPENGIDTPAPTKEFLTGNAAKWGGDQKGKPKPAKQGAVANSTGYNSVKPLYESPILRHSNPPSHSVEIDVALPDGSKEIALVIDDAGDGFSHDWAGWEQPRLVMRDGSEKKLTDLNWKTSKNQFGRMNKNANCQGKAMQVHGVEVANGIGAHANALTVFDLPQGAKRFKARGFLDDGGTVRGTEATPTSVKFLVYNQAPPARAKSGDAYVKNTSAPGRDAKDAVADLEVHPELKVQLFASEPMITSPSSIDIDEKGRVWVCDVVNYRRNQGKRPQGDRILILEDANGDAKADKSTVFYQGNDIDSAHGICVLGDRVIISAGEEIFSLYDRDGDGKADLDSKEMMFTKIGGKQHDHGIHAVHFGPDGRLYFNFGNAGKQLCDGEGNLITDIHGIPCRTDQRPYQQGMVFRCELDGSNVEMLGWNFRNNWEACVDAFGNIWQSDNDDDGNKGVRINYVMEYGNYGYRDEITGGGWRDPRPGMSEEIPERHWHLRDPGVVPNLVQTGAGSPTGICVYEGGLLPKIFQGQVIHCDAGPNVVRAYPAKAQGAGYNAEMVNILKAKTDNWFRPSDVCVAPDGSLFVADWYDPGVGGHGMRDLEKGRIFRVIPKEANDRYTTKSVQLDTEKGAFAALTSPNMATRYLGWNAYLDPKFKPEYRGRTSEKARLLYNMNVLFEGDWAPEKEVTYHENNEDLLVVALRAIRQTSKGSESRQLAGAVASLCQHESPKVRRECALALRYLNTESCNRSWAALAKHYDGKDRWHLEALGIGADLFWDDRLAAVEDLSQLHPDIIWRSRGKKSAQLIAEVVVEGKTKNPAYIRALHFQPDPAAKTAAYEKIFLKADQQPALLAAGKLGSDAIEKLDGGPERLDALIGPIRGTAEFVQLATRLNLGGFSGELIEFIVTHPESPGEAASAARMLLNDLGATRAVFHGNDLGAVGLLASALANTNDRNANRGHLTNLLSDKRVAAAAKKAIANGMSASSTGADALLRLVEAGKLEEDLKPTVALAMARHTNPSIRNRAAKKLPPPKAPGADQFPDLSQLVAMKGSAAQGKDLFTKATCATCHQIKGEGINFGPDLSEIGNKLSREALFQAILHPGAAISHGYHGLTVTKKDGAMLVGFSTGETDTELQMRLPGGVQQNIAKKEIAKSEPLGQSLMPPGLANVIGVQGLVDLVTWMQNLK